MASEKLIIEIDLDLNTRDIKNVSKKIERDLGKAGDKASESFGGSFAGGLRKSLSSLSGVAIAAGASLTAIFAGREIIDAAIRQEDAIRRVETSLKRIGEFSQETSQDLQNFASELQSTTRIGDEAALEQLAFAQGLGATAQQSKLVVAAAADLAAALDIDLNTATRNVGRTLGGFAGELGEVIPELKNLTQEQLRAGDGVTLLARKFSGFAANEAQGFGASLDQLSNSFGDFLEALGGLVVGSDKAEGALGALGVALDFYTNKLKAANQEPLTLDQLEESISKTEVSIQRLQNRLNQQSNLGGVGGFLRDLTGGSDRLKKELDAATLELLDFEQRRRNLLNQRQQQDEIRNANESLKRQQAAEKEKSDLERQLSELGIVTVQKLEQNAVLRLETLERLRQAELISAEEFNSQVLRTEEEFERKRLDILGKGAKARNKASFDAGKAFGNIVASGTQTFVNSLLEGQDASKAFGDFILQSFGGLATQLGQFYIATGIANKALFGLSSPAAQIAAGVALVALGGILGSFASGGLGGGADTGGGAGIDTSTDFGAGTPVSDTTTNQIVEEDLSPQNVTNITVEGLIGGRQLVDIINDAADQEDIKLNVSLA